MTTGPTEESVKSTLNLSEEFLDDSRANLEQDRFRTSVDRAYYSIHYAAQALLVSRGIKAPRTHRGLVNVFGREVVNRGVLGKEFSSMLSQSLRDRMDSTYSPEAEIMRADAEGVLEDARRFVAEVRSILQKS